MGGALLFFALVPDAWVGGCLVPRITACAACGGDHRMAVLAVLAMTGSLIALGVWAGRDGKGSREEGIEGSSRMGAGGAGGACGDGAVTRHLAARRR